MQKSLSFTLQICFLVLLLVGCGGGVGGTNPAFTYTVTYNGNGNATGSVPTDATTYEAGQTVTVLGNTGNLTKTGYSFSGWNTQADGSGATYPQSQTFTMGSANVILYARWTANPTYTVTYNGSGNTGGSVPTDSNRYEQGQTVTVSTNTGNLTKTNYTFAGWNTAADGSGTDYATSGVATFTMGSSNVTLYAKWTAPGELKVISITPLNGATNAARDGVVTAIFSHTLDASTVSAVTLTVTDEQQYSIEADAIIVDGNKATFKSKNKLVADRKYIVTITTEIKGINGEVMSGDYLSDFKTQSSQWSSPELISSANYVKTAMDDHGNAITVWWRYNSSNGHYEILMSELSGGNWSNAEVISGNATNVYNPGVAMDNNGNAIIVWADWGNFSSTGGIVMIEYRNGVWSAPRFINTGAFIAPYPPSVVMNDNGKAVIVWAQQDIDKLEYVNGSWSDPIAVSTGGYAEEPHVAMNDKGNSIITWLYNDGIASHKKIFSSEFLNGMWSSPTIVSNPGYDPAYHTIAFDDNDNAVVVWTEGYQKVFRNEYHNGNWLGPVSVSSSATEYVIFPTVAMDGRGNAVMAWQQSINLIYHVFISESRGGVWSAPTQVSTLGTSAANPFVKMDKSGNAILLWNQADATDKQVYRMQYLNGIWTNKYLMVVSHDQLNNVVYDVAMDGSGDAIIAWDQSDGSTWSIYRSFYQ